MSGIAVSPPYMKRWQPGMCGAAEGADQMETRHPGQLGERGQGDRLGVVPVQVVPHPAEGEHRRSLSSDG